MKNQSITKAIRVHPLGPGMVVSDVAMCLIVVEIFQTGPTEHHQHGSDVTPGFLLSRPLTVYMAQEVVAVHHFHAVCNETPQPLWDTSRV